MAKQSTQQKIQSAISQITATHSQMMGTNLQRYPLKYHVFRAWQQELAKVAQELQDLTVELDKAEEAKVIAPKAIPQPKTEPASTVCR